MVSVLSGSYLKKIEKIPSKKGLASIDIPDIPSFVPERNRSKLERIVSELKNKRNISFSEFKNYYMKVVGNPSPYEPTITTWLSIYEEHYPDEINTETALRIMKKDSIILYDPSLDL